MITQINLINQIKSHRMTSKMLSFPIVKAKFSQPL